MQQLTTQIHDTHTQSCISLSAIFQVNGGGIGNNADENSSIFSLKGRPSSAVTSWNLNQFSKFFHVRVGDKFAVVIANPTTPKRIATPPCEILMSENQWQCETVLWLTINHKALYLGIWSVGWFSTTNLLQNYCWVCGERTLISLNSGKATGKKSDCLTCSRVPWHCADERRELAWELEYSEKQLLLSVVTLILTWFRQLSNWCRLILTCQLTPSATDWMLMITCERILLWSLFFCCGRFVQSAVV